MRPKRLELQGFASYRDPVVIDFEGCDLFVLTGPTGSGKSSIVDGITFALYGSVPRYDDARLVQPIISKGREEARVRFDFTIGTDEYSAVRVVRRTSSGGATTRDARLECNGEPIAGSRDEVNAAVVARLGLELEHFQKCVVLPQGQFAQFLHDNTKARQSLLTNLLGIEYLGAIRSAAHLRRVEAEQVVKAIDAQLEGPLAHATAAALQVMEKRIAVLSRLQEEIEREAASVAKLDQECREAERLAAESAEAAKLLAGVAVPEGVDRLSEALAEAEAGLREVEDAAGAAQRALAERQAAFAALPDKSSTEAVIRDWQQLAELTAHVAKATTAHEEAVAYAITTEAERAKAQSLFEGAESRREAILNENYAYRLASALKAGETCPVCGETLKAAPVHAAPPGHGEATEVRDSARKAADGADEAAKKATDARTRAEERLRGLEARVGELRPKLEGRPGLPAATDQLALIVAAEAARSDSERALTGALDRRAEAAERAQTARTAAEGGWDVFSRIRDSVARLEPPEYERASLAIAWQALAAWGQREAAGRGTAADEARERALTLAREQSALVEVMRQRCIDAEVGGALDDPARAVHGELERCRARRGQLESDIERAEGLAKDRDQQKAAGAVAEALWQHLHVDRFEKWYVRRVIQQLVAGASETLWELSRKQFSLGMSDNGEFEVVDHANADERRFIRTLSGGETFLAALSLALALAEILGGMAKERAGRLEAIFLDEGFGTLDPETLDVVATAMEELAAGGRMVGLVTHVPELAARIPTRFEVRKGPRGSTVERVEA